MDHAVRSSLEKRLTRQAAQQSLSESEYLLYTGCTHYERYLCGAGKVLALWRVRDGQPIIENIYRVVSVAVDAYDGFSAKIVGDDCSEQRITHHPTQLGHNTIFANFPFFPETMYQPVGVNSRMLVRFPLVFRQASSPSTTSEGIQHLTDIPRLVDLFPQYEGVKF